MVNTVTAIKITDLCFLLNSSNPSKMFVLDFYKNSISFKQTTHFSEKWYAFHRYLKKIFLKQDIKIRYSMKMWHQQKQSVTDGQKTDKVIPKWCFALLVPKTWPIAESAILTTITLP